MEGTPLMSWAAHELENFYFLKKLGQKVSYLGLLAGALAPDVLTKLYTYGFNLGGVEFAADNPAQWHRGWPGMGFTTSLMAGLILAIFVYIISKGNKAWFIGILVGYSAHVITDSTDTVGVMMFWPFYNENISIGAWAYGAVEGKHGDAIAYYSCLGFVMDTFWIAVVGLFAWQTLSKEYFETVVVPADPAWGWLQRKFHMPDRALLAFYRAFFFYGVCRTVAWTMWAHLIMGAPWDLSWGGPHWVAPFEPW